jgi:DNA-binding response OmpR family regulator
MVTTETNEKLRDEGKEAGIRVWLIKPVPGDKFLKTVQLLLASTKQ